MRERGLTLQDVRDVAQIRVVAHLRDPASQLQPPAGAEPQSQPPAQPASGPSQAPPTLPSTEGRVSGEQRRADIVAYHLGDAWRLIVDLVLANGATEDLVNAVAALTKPLAGAAKAEARKVSDYLADTPPGFEFIAFGMGLQTELGPSAAKLVRKIATLIATRSAGDQPPAAEAVAKVQIRCHARLGVACMRGQAQQILACIKGTAEAALADAKHHAHTRYRRAYDAA
jgi:hypothetical protein